MTAETEKPLPELHQANLDAATLEAFFEDLAACAKIIEVISKASAGYAAPTSISLDEGRILFLDGKLRGLQIRYLYQGSEWWDTLLNTPNGVRITRIKQDFQNNE